MRRSWFGLAAFCIIALTLASAAIAQPHASFESLLVSAQTAQARSDFQSAAQFYAQAAQLHPEIAELNANLGLMYYQTGKDAEAIDALLRAHRLKPALFVPNMFLGLEYVKLKRFKEAVPYLQRATAANPADIQAQMSLGQAYAGIGDTHFAIRSYLSAARLEPANADTWYHLGLGYLEQVEADARILLTRYKDSSYLHALMADNFAERRAFSQASDAYEKTLSSAEFPPGTRANYALVLVNNHDLAGAERELNAELATNPGCLIAELVMARLELERGEIQPAAKQIALIWTTDAGFLTSNFQRLKAGLADAKRSELMQALEDLAAAGSLSQDAVNLFRASENRNGPTTANSATSSEPDHPAGGDAAAFYRRGEYRRCSDALAERVSALAAMICAGWPRALIGPASTGRPLRPRKHWPRRL